MAKIEISDADSTEEVYYIRPDEGSPSRSKLNVSDLARPNVKSKLITQLSGMGVSLFIILWAAYIVASGKKIDSFDVITFEFVITLIICLTIAMRMRRLSVH